MDKREMEEAKFGGERKTTEKKRIKKKMVREERERIKQVNGKKGKDVINKGQCIIVTAF
jgi:hypothetical protein